jgi:hypothetical protein
MKQVNNSTQPERPGGLLAGPQYGLTCVLNAPVILIVITGQAQKSMLVGALHLVGLPGDKYRGRGGLFQNRETKGTLPGDQLQVMVQAGGGLPWNNHAKPKMAMTDVTAPPAFGAPFLRSLCRSLFVSSF